MRIEAASASSDRSIIALRVAGKDYQILVDGDAQRLLRPTRDSEKGTHGPCWIDVCDKPSVLAGGLAFRDRLLAADERRRIKARHLRAMSGPGVSY